MISSLIMTLTGVLAASILRGFTGFGFGLAAVPLLLLALPPAQVVPLVVTLQVVIGLAGLRAASTQCDWRAVRLLFPGLILGVPIGLLILTTLPANLVRLVIGGIIAASVVLIKRGARLPPHPSRLVSFGVGLVSGIISGLASMGGPPIIVYLLAAGHTPARMRATAIVYFMLSGCVSLIPMAARGLITQDILIWTVASLPVLFGGSRLGTWAFHRAKPRHHRLVALVTLSGLAALLIGRALLG
ncbi:MAG: sulfite exporter TauE/SafE family protein [Rhodopila sp.]|nr:sulfite exporter TauE/SafE family protein [Rhodopila sp.]